MIQSNFPHFFLMDNVIQNYPWGSRTSINQIFDIPNLDNEPQAEIWMGAHNNGCSSIMLNDEKILLSDFIESDKAFVLGEDTAVKFAELPYLFKVLAAESALSIQVHPSKEQAEQGFQKENEAGISVSASNRNYRDANHKPELVYALTPYQAMNGFREFDEIIGLFKSLAIPSLAVLIADFESASDKNGLQDFFTAIMSLKKRDKKIALDGLIDYAQKHKEQVIFALVLDLAVQYPGDIGLFSPLLLNVLTLQPGEAMYLDACTPHAYIKGTGLEIMANSDNVLRAGLTPKHIDVSELVSCTHFVSKPKDTLLLTPEKHGNALCYSIPVEDFKFTVFEKTQALALNSEGAEIIMALDSDVICSYEDGSKLSLSKGQSAFIPAYTKTYVLESEGRVARAFN